MKSLPPSSPTIETLPTEVINEIFLACVDSGLLHPSHAPLLLTHISSKLRHIAVCTPALWSKLDFVICYPTKSSRKMLAKEEAQALVKSQMDLYKKCLKRSGSLPLSINFKVEVVATSQPHQSAIWGFTQALASCGPRLRNLVMNYGHTMPPDCYEPLLELTSDDIPQLQSLAVSRIHQYHRVSACNLFGARSLQDLSLHSYNYTSLQALRVCWANLTKLTLTLRADTRFILEREILTFLLTHARVLSQATQLAFLSLDLIRVGDDNIIDPITLPRVKVLEVTIRYLSYPSICKYLNAPELETLHIRGHFPECQNVLLRNSLLLRNLVFSEIRDKPIYDTLSARLVYCPQITFLSLEWSNTRAEPVIITGVLEVFVEDRDGTFLCPNLREFMCNRIIKTSLDNLSRFLGMGEGDTVQQRPFRRISMEVKLPDWNEEMKQAVDALVAEKRNDLDLQLRVALDIKYDIYYDPCTGLFV